MKSTESTAFTQTGRSVCIGKHTVAVMRWAVVRLWGRWSDRPVALPAAVRDAGPHHQERRVPQRGQQGRHQAAAAGGVLEGAGRPVTLAARRRGALGPRPPPLPRAGHALRCLYLQLVERVVRASGRHAVTHTAPANWSLRV